MTLFKRTLRPQGRPIYIDGAEVTYGLYSINMAALEAARKELAELRLKTSPKHPKHPQVTKELAFTCGGIDYYTCSLDQMPPKRWQEYLLRHEENRMGCSREFLLELNAAVLKELSGKRGEIDQTVITQHMHELQARLKLAPIKDHLYRLVSVCFFPLDEDLTTYSMAENNAKIEHWKKHNEPADFFFNQRVKDLVNFTEQSREDLADFFRKQAIIMKSRGIHSHT